MTAEMKKLIALSFVICVVLCSCSAYTEPDEICVNRIFNSEADIQFNETAYTADFTFNENGCSAVFSLPEEISGLTFSTDGNATTYSLGNLEYTAEETQNQTMLINAIYSAVTSLPQTATLNEQTYILQGTSEYGKYIMYINKDTFIPTFIEYEDKDITVKFRQST